MSQAKIQFTLGEISFSGEGDETWVAAQLDKLLEKAPTLVDLAPRSADSERSDKGETHGQKGKAAPGTLAAFLSAAGATSNQTKRFLATAEWLHRKGSKHVKTSDVTKALTDNQQKRLGNPADTLNKNVAKGFCEKVGSDGFYVTDEGRTSLGNA